MNVVNCSTTANQSCPAHPRLGTTERVQQPGQFSSSHGLHSDQQQHPSTSHLGSTLKAVLILSRIGTSCLQDRQHQAQPPLLCAVTHHESGENESPTTLAPLAASCTSAYAIGDHVW